jgi:outer membrane biosynthesis protein TonB
VKRLSILALLIGCAPAEKPVAPVAPQPDAEPKTCPVPATADTPHAQMMPSSLIETRRLAGERGIGPEDTTKQHIHEKGIAAVRADVLMCLDDAGTPTAITMSSSSCEPEYDARILKLMADWRYKPFEIGGKASAVCTTVTYVYRQDNARPVAP